MMPPVLVMPPVGEIGAAQGAVCEDEALIQNRDAAELSGTHDRDARINAQRAVAVDISVGVIEDKRSGAGEFDRQAVKVDEGVVSAGGEGEGAVVGQFAGDVRFRIVFHEVVVAGADGHVDAGWFRAAGGDDFAGAGGDQEAADDGGAVIEADGRAGIRGDGAAGVGVAAAIKTRETAARKANDAAGVG